MGRPQHELSILEVDALEIDLQAREDAAMYEIEDEIFSLVEKRYPSTKPTGLGVAA